MSLGELTELTALSRPLGSAAAVPGQKCCRTETPRRERRGRERRERGLLRRMEGAQRGWYARGQAVVQVIRRAPAASHSISGISRPSGTILGAGRWAGKPPAGPLSMRPMADQAGAQRSRAGRPVGSSAPVDSGRGDRSRERCSRPRAGGAPARRPSRTRPAMERHDSWPIPSDWAVPPRPQRAAANPAGLIPARPAAGSR